jgi:hypothetical protein
MNISKSEPGDDARVPEQPRLLRRTVELLVSSGVLPLDAIPRHIGLSMLSCAVSTTCYRHSWPPLSRALISATFHPNLPFIRTGLIGPFS